MSSTRSKVNQSLAGLGVFLINMTTGLSVGWSSAGWLKITLPDQGPFLANLDEASWIVAMVDVGIPLGSVVSGLLLTSVGRRPTLMVAPAMYLLASALMYWGTSAPYLYVARTLMGISFGIDLACSCLFIGEIASSDMRGKLCTFTTSVVFVGVLLEYCVGPYVSYWNQVLIAVPAPLISLLLLALWVPETPYYLAMKNRTDDMYKSLAKLRGLSDPADAEVLREGLQIKKAIGEELRCKTTWKQFFSSRGNVKGSGIVLFLCGTCPLLGTGSLMAYAEYMFKATGSAISSDVSSIIMCAVSMTAGVASSQVIDRAGRRPLLLVTAFFDALAMAAVGTYFFFKDQGQDVSGIAWLPLVALITFMISTNIGTTTVPWVVMGELLPHQSKAFVPSLSVIVFSLSAFATNKLFPVLANRFGMYLPFWGFGVWALVDGLFTYLFVPETRGKTLVEVQEMLHASESTSVASGESGCQQKA